MSNKPISPFLTTAIGAQNIGKTYTTLLQCLYKAYSKANPMRVLLFETNLNEFRSKILDKTEHKFESIRPENISKYSTFKGGDMRRISPVHPNGQPMNPEDTLKLLWKTCSEYRDGILVVEDFTVLTGDTIDKTTAGLLTNLRHRGVFLFLHLQGLGAIVPKVRRNTKIIRMHYSTELVSQVADKIKDGVEIFYIAEKLINKQYESGNTHFFVYVYNMQKKIVGEFSNRMLTDAIQEYILENPSLLRPITNRTDLQGNKLYNYSEAVNLKTLELYRKYQGNGLNLQPDM